MTRLAIVGTGAWGTALAIHGANKGLDVALLGRRPDVVERLAATRVHPALAGAPPIPPRVTITTDAREAFVGGCRRSLVGLRTGHGEGARAARAVPARASRRDVQGPRDRIAPEDHRDHVLRHRGGRTASPHSPARRSRPEVARGLPAAAVVASADPDVATALQALLSSPTLRLYRSADVLGVEIAGAAKNVVAIAAGLVDGLRLGHNTRAALLTRALAEIRRLGTRLGGSPETFSGLAGVGDLILTATGDLSRNRRVGLALASGKSLTDAVAALGGEVAEGVATSPVLLELAEKAGVEMPIAAMVASILSGRTTPTDAVRNLMTRALKEEKV